MILDDGKYCTEKDTWCIYQTVKHTIHGKYDPEKYGLYSKKFQNTFDTIGGNIVHFRAVQNNMNTELRIATYFAANVARNLGWVNDFKEEHYTQLRKFNSSTRFMQMEIADLLEQHSTKELFSEKILNLLASGKISKELFSVLLVGTDLDEILLNSSQSYIWKIMRNSNLAYSKFISHCNDKNQLINTLSTSFNQ